MPILLGAVHMKKLWKPRKGLSGPLASNQLSCCSCYGLWGCHGNNFTPTHPSVTWEVEEGGLLLVHRGINVGSEICGDLLLRRNAVQKRSTSVPLREPSYV